MVIGCKASQPIASRLLYTPMAHADPYGSPLATRHHQHTTEAGADAAIQGRTAVPARRPQIDFPGKIVPLTIGRVNQRESDRLRILALSKTAPTLVSPRSPREPPSSLESSLEISRLLLLPACLSRPRHETPPCTCAPGRAGFSHALPSQRSRGLKVVAAAAKPP